MSKRRKDYRRRKGYSKHHRKPKSRGGKNTFGNISVVPNSKHRAWHTLFANKTAPEIAKIINKTWLDPEYELVVVLRNSKPPL